MEDLPHKITVGEKYGPAMKITDQAEATQYFERLVRHNMSHGHSREEAEAIERNNLGYFAGYYDGETRDRVLRLFSAPHPIFGGSHPTPEQAFRAGMDHAQKALKR